MRRPNTEEDFWKRVTKTDDCWHWAGRKISSGYGHFDFCGKVKLAHRLSWMFWYGPFDEGLDVLHKCDNPGCVRPDHLWLGTHQDNMKDKIAKGRQPCGEAIKTAKLTEDQVADIKAVGKTVPRKVMASKYGVSPQLVSNILAGRKWRHVKA